MKEAGLRDKKERFVLRRITTPAELRESQMALSIKLSKCNSEKVCIPNLKSKRNKLNPKLFPTPFIWANTEPPK